MKQLIKKISIIIIIAILQFIIYFITGKVNADAEEVESWNISGDSNSNVTATLYNDRKLIISGNGKMKDYDYIEQEYDIPYIDKDVLEVEIENGITSIGRYSFFKCSKIKKINILANIEKIEDGAFQHCELLEEINLPNSLEKIGKYVFADCKNIKEIEIPSNVKEIGKYAFIRCSVLEKINLPSALETIEGNPFSKCAKLKNIDLDVENDNFIIEDGVLMTKDKTRIIFCSKDKEGIFNIFETIKKIDEYAIYNCDLLQGINISSGVEEIGNAAFGHCDKLTSVNIDQNTENFIMDKGILYNKDKTRILICSRDKQEESYELPSTVETIDQYAFFNCDVIKNIILPENLSIIQLSTFYNCKAIENITLPDNIKEIGENAFYNCILLQEINIPNNVIEIGDHAFSCCRLLQEVNIPDSVTKIRNYSFMDCDSLQEINIPSSVEEIGNHAFGFCDKLTSVKINQNNENFIMENGILYNKDKTRILICSRDSQEESYQIPSTVETIDQSAFYNCNTIKSMVLPEGITKIGRSTFCNCTALKNITLPNSIKEIGDYTFYGCTSLQTVNIPNNVETIGECTFYGCKLLQEVNIPDSVTKIGNSAFCDCDSLQEINIPSSVEEIGNQAFGFCDVLTSVKINGNNENFIMENGILYNKDKTRILICSRDSQKESYQIPSTVETIDQSAFANCNTIKSMLLPEGITKIERSTFYNCTELENINIPNTVISIFPYAFGNCKKIKTISIPKSVEEIMENAFGECELEKVYISSKHKDYAVENNLPYEIDDTSPNIDKIEGNLTEKTSGNVVLKVTASDNQSGLAMSAYSFDNGETWQESNEKTYSKNTQGIIIKVRDKIGNETTYEEEININNIEKIIKELKIKQMPNKLEYIKGENLDLTGIVLEVEYEDGTKEELTEGFTVDKENLDTLGTVEITINYENVSTTFNVNVSEKQDEDKQDEDKQDEDKQDEDKQDEDKQDEDKQDEDKQDEDKQDEDKQDEDKQDEDKQDGDKQDEDKKQDGDKQDENKQDENKQNENKQDGDKQDGDKQETIKGKEDPDTANDNKTAKNTITNLSNSKLPYTGLIGKLMPIGIIITLSVAIVTCIGYIKYK